MIEIEYVVEFCKCEGDRQVQQLGRFKHANLSDGGHTAFLLIRCNKCRKLDGFPRYNFRLAIFTGTPRLWLTILNVAHWMNCHSS